VLILYEIVIFVDVVGFSLRTTNGIFFTPLHAQIDLARAALSGATGEGKQTPLVRDQ
jgi:hypothetical protein